jgi:uncharacterized protein
MIIDAHTHIDRANKVDWTPEQLLAGMDEAGIDYSLVISNHVTEAPIDKVLAVTKPFSRFKVIGNVEYETFGSEQVEKLTKHLEKREIVGVKLYPGYENYFPNDEKFDPLFSYCEKNGHPIMIHTGVLMVGCKGFSKQAHPLVVDEIAAKYPKLKIVIAHFGNPWIIDTIAVMWRNANVYTDLSGFFGEFKPLRPLEVEGFLERMEQARKLLVGFKKCIFGTDWPLYNQKEYIEAVRKIPMTDEEAEKVFYKNALEVFNLDWK